MPDSILLKNGVIADSTGTRKADILIREGVIASIRKGIAPEDGVPTLDISGCTVTPALADVHVHFREPGNPEKETIASGSRAAAAGGYTAVCAMPNLNPCPDTVEHLKVETDIIRDSAIIDVYPYATITEGREGLRPVDVKSLKDAAIAFSDDGSGVQKDEVMEEAMSLIAGEGAILAAHCEDNSLLDGGYIHEGRYASRHGHKGISSRSEWSQIERDLRLAEKTGCRYHVCHISTRESVELIRQAKKRGVKVTCETAPHYLTLTDSCLREDGRFKMNPPLRSEDDRQALIQGIKDGTIDVIATDHAPHTAEQKSRGLQGSAMGIVGLESAFPVLYTHLIRRGIISMAQLLRLISSRPRTIFGLRPALIEEGAPAELAVFETSRPFQLDPAQFRSKGHSTPFEGWNLYGRCLMTFHCGNKIFEDLKQ